MSASSASQSRSVVAAASSRVAVASAAPDWQIARRNSPRASGMASRHPMLIAPADSPNTVTSSGSPPNAAMCSRTHRSAAIWSSSPSTPLSGCADDRCASSRKPNAPNR